MRRLFSNYFIFKVNKKSLAEIFEEFLGEKDKDLVNHISKIVLEQ
jgi:hypothetical protein